LDGCSFTAHFGEIHAIVGGNGCGKSTLAKVLSGVLPLDSGKVSILGHHPTSPAEARDLGIATVFQEVMIADEATVVDNLFTGADGFWTKSMSAGEKIKKAQILMRELAGEEIDPLMLAGNLPLSIKAWITIARALLCDPKVLILDESSAALDFDLTERLFTKMRELRDKGTAILIVTHRIAELIRISDRATVDRCIARDGTQIDQRRGCAEDRRYEGLARERACRFRAYEGRNCRRDRPGRSRPGRFRTYFGGRWPGEFRLSRGQSQWCERLPCH
jgi:ribose transport system ATP-binding protein